MRALAVIAAAGLAACESLPSRPASVLHCENGEVVEVGYAGDMAVVRYKGRKLTMRTAISGSGARYVGDGWQWWSRGFEEGTITPLKPGETVASAEPVICRAGPPPADAGPAVRQ